MDILKVAPYVENVEFIISAGDIPARLSTDENVFEELPVFSYSKTADHIQKQYLDILIPCYYDAAIEHICKDTQNNISFKNKKNKVFGRFAGKCRETSDIQTIFGKPLVECPRNYFSELSLNNSEILDIMPTTNFDFFNKVSVVPVASIVEQKKHKYILNIDGLGRACSFEQYLALDAVVLHGMSSLISYWDQAAVPFVHYVPIQSIDDQDIFTAREFLENNPEIAEEIAAEAKKFACEQLSTEKRLAYWIELLKQYKKIFSTNFIFNPAQRNLTVTELKLNNFRCYFNIYDGFPVRCNYKN